MIELGLVDESDSNEHFNVKRDSKSSTRKKRHSQRLSKNFGGQIRTIETRQSRKSLLENTFECLTE